MRKIYFYIVFMLAFLSGSAQCWKEISAGIVTSVGIKTNGTLWAWGWNPSGILGTSSSALNLITPTQIGTSNLWQSVDMYAGHCAAIQANGTLWAWGENIAGELGNGTTISTSIPIQVGTSNNWKSVDVGEDFTLAIQNNGTLWAWGGNNAGQLGDGTNIDKHLPVQIGTDTDWQSVSAGNRHAKAIKTNGTLWSWGYNSQGVLGIGTNAPLFPSTPIQIGTTTNWQSVTTGFDTDMAIKTDGTLWGWGSNFSGLLGDGTVISKNSPVQIGTDQDWLSVSVNFHGHSLAIKTNGTLWSSGLNIWGQLGNGTNTDLTVHGLVGLTGNAQKISAGYMHSLAINATGDLFSWGRNQYGELSYDTTLIHDINIPIKVPSLNLTMNLSPTNTLCAGTSITLMANGATTYSWTGGVTNGVSFTPLASSNYTVTGSDGLGCSNTATISITVIPVSNTSFTYPSILCNSDVNPLPLLNPDFAPGGSFSSTTGLQVNNVTGEINLLASLTGTYTITYTINAVNCLQLGSNSQTITVHPNPVLTTSSSTVIINGEQTIVTANSSANTYTWFPTTNLSCTNCANPTASPNVTTNYCVQITDGVCTNSACINVIVESLCEGDKGLYLPNAFSPNGDGNNDVFCVQGETKCTTDFKMLIFDRWGEKVFESTVITFCWDGTYKSKVLNPDVYVYYITAINKDQEKITKKGNVTLIK